MNSIKCQSKVLANVYNSTCFQFRTISHSDVLKRNHYDSLGITPKATQADIKTAYYKLSMTYHPDRNKGCKEAATKFHDITNAYEILSNFRLRRLYDKGIIHTAGAQYATPDAATEPVVEPEEDDPQTKFYKRHMTKTQAPHASGRTPIYNFDEWTNAHYGKTFIRNQAAREKHREREDVQKRHAGGLKAEKLAFGILILLTTVGFFSTLLDKSLDNTVKPKNQ